MTPSSVDSYDDANRQVRSEDGTGRVTSKAFDEAGNLLCVKEALGTGHLTHGAAAGKTLEELKTVACVPGGYVTRYAYDEVGKQTSLTDANGSRWAFQYDEARNLVAKLDANGHLTTYGYDARNQRTQELAWLGENQTLPSRGGLPVPGVNYTYPSTTITLPHRLTC